MKSPAPGSQPVDNLNFMQGGGEMGKLTREKDWSGSPVGTPESWPQSLRTALGIVLHSKFPMFLFWGQELVCFYNDAYRPSLGNDGKHPGILGIRGEEAWPEIWAIIKPLIDQVLTTGEATFSEDQLIPIYRNGKIEDVYWTFSYSPVNDESGRAAGVFVTCSETTGKVKAMNDLKESRNQLLFAIDAAELGTWDLDPATNIFTGNDRLKNWFGLRASDDIDLATAMDIIDEKDRPRVTAAIQRSLQYSSGGHYEIDYTIIHPEKKTELIVRAKGKASFDENQQPVRFDGTMQDITIYTLAKRKNEESEKRFRNVVRQAPLGITILRGPQFMVEMANENYLQLVDRSEEQFVGRPLFEALPEVKEAVETILNKVLSTGEPYYGMEFPVSIDRFGKKELTYFNFVYHPVREEDGEITGIIVVAIEVTASVNAKLTLAESEKQFRNLVMQSPIPMAIFAGPDFVIELANKNMFEKMWRKKEAEVVGKKLLEVFPELTGQKYPELLNRVFNTGKVHRENEALAYVQGDDGLKKFYLDFEYAPLSGPDGEVTSIMVTVNDVTGRVEARQQVENAEERLRLAAEATELATWDLDLKTRDIIYSPRLPEIFGHDSDFIFTHQAMRSQIHPDDIHSVVEQAFDIAMQTGLYRYEARLVTPAGDVRWIRTQGKVFFDENRKASKMIGTLRDITVEKHHEAELLESEQKFRLLADFMPQYVWTADPAGKLNYFNKSVFEYSGLPPQWLYDGGWLQTMHPDERQEYTKRWNYAIATGEDYLYEHRFRRHDGDYRWQLSRAIPQRDVEGKIQMWVGTSTDIQQLKEEEQQKDFFISMASHELKTPITSIKGYVQLLQMMYANGTDEMLQKSLTSMDKQVAKLTALIGDLLDLSKIRSGSLFLNKESFIIDDLVAEAVAEIRHINPDYSIMYSGKHATPVFADRERIGQVIINLLTNAVKYSPEAKDIKVESRLEDDRVLVSVEDAGIGINKKDQAKIFERFYRVEGKNEKTFPGFGIGLFISMEIIHRHHGEIGVFSEPGKGSEFYFSIPLQQ